MVELLLINGLTVKRKRRGVNRISPAGFRKFQSVFLLLFLINWLFLNRLHDKNFSFHYYGLKFVIIALTGTGYNLN